VSAVRSREHRLAADSPRASVLVCTYRRDQVLVDTLRYLLPQCERAGAELIVVDQLADHPAHVRDQLASWADARRIRYMNLTQSGLTHARNVGAEHAGSDLLIFFDDDIVPSEDVVERHIANYGDPSVAAVAGQVLNVGAIPAYSPGSFSHSERIEAFDQLYGANFSLRRSVYRAIGGSDEQLKIHAYTEDKILAQRLARGGHRICYDPGASVVHLMSPSGGCRITDDTQPTAESEKSFSTLYWMFLAREQSGRDRRRTLWSALRQGPLRRGNVVQPWRQPSAWIGFGVAMVKAFWKARGVAAGRP
jgi:GT2 family glycosyltransferase